MVEGALAFIILTLSIQIKPIILTPILILIPIDCIFYFTTIQNALRSGRAPLLLIITFAAQWLLIPLKVIFTVTFNLEGGKRSCVLNKRTVEYACFFRIPPSKAILTLAFIQALSLCIWDYLAVDSALDLLIVPFIFIITNTLFENTHRYWIVYSWTIHKTTHCMRIPLAWVFTITLCLSMMT